MKKRINKGEEIVIRGQHFVGIGNNVLEGFCPGCGKKFTVGGVVAQRKGEGMRCCKRCKPVPEKPKRPEVDFPRLMAGEQITIRGQTYTYLYSEQYTTPGGKHTGLVMRNFETNCSECGAECEIKASERELRAGYLTRRCKEHRKRGVPVGGFRLSRNQVYALETLQIIGEGREWVPMKEWREEIRWTLDGLVNPHQAFRQIWQALWNREKIEIRDGQVRQKQEG